MGYLTKSTPNAMSSSRKSSSPCLRGNTFLTMPNTPLMSMAKLWPNTAATAADSPKATANISPVSTRDSARSLTKDLPPVKPSKQQACRQPPAAPVWSALVPTPLMISVRWLLHLASSRDPPNWLPCPLRLLVLRMISRMISTLAHSLTLPQMPQISWTFSTPELPQKDPAGRALLLTRPTDCLLIWILL